MLSRVVRRAVAGVALVAVCVASVVTARGTRARSMTDAGLQARTKGEAAAPVLLVEYSDFQCPSCKYAQPAIGALLKQYGASVRLVFRHFPLDMHPRAFGAAMAAECAGFQGRFWPYHDLLFGSQEEWATAADSRVVFSQYAEKLGLSIDKFQPCLESAEARAAVMRDIAEGGAWQVNSTPTLFVGHKRLVGAKQIQLYGPGIIEKQLKGIK